MSNVKTLFIMSGSIAAFKACQVISQLVKAGDEVQVVTTASLKQFIGPATLEGLTGKPALEDMWEHGQAMDHIQLTRWADRAILCPASANTIAHMAHGFADDLVGALVLAWPHEKPFFVFPAMNSVMLEAEATQTNLQTLRQRGFRVAQSNSGSLACGEVGGGRLLEPTEILEHLRLPKRGRVLVTGGATREPIDAIRFIANVSTGQTAASLVDGLEMLGYAVTFLHGIGAVQPQHSHQQIVFTTCEDLQGHLRNQLGKNQFISVVHAAAVGDFKVENASVKEKLSSVDSTHIHLIPNPKLLSHLKEFALGRPLKVVGFKLTYDADPRPSAQQSLSSDVDLVVANEWQQVSADRSKHPGWLVGPGGSIPFIHLAELIQHLHAFLEKGKL